MNTLLSEQEKSALRGIIESPLMQKAFVEVLRGTYIDKSGAATLEQCAMAHNYTEGARAALNRLVMLAEMKDVPEQSVGATRRFRPTND